jgi:hypothetical protein
MAYSKKNLCHLSNPSDVWFYELLVIRVLQASNRFKCDFSGNLTAFDQVVFRVKNLKKFSDINLSFDAGIGPFLYAVGTVFVGFITFSEPVFAERELIWPS